MPPPMQAVAELVLVLTSRFDASSGGEKVLSKLSSASVQHAHRYQRGKVSTDAQRAARDA